MGLRAMSASDALPLGAAARAGIWTTPARLRECPNCGKFQVVPALAPAMPAPMVIAA